MQNCSKSNNKHEYANILKEKCKIWRFGLHVQRSVRDDLQRDVGDEQACFFFQSRQGMAVKHSTLSLGLENVPNVDFDLHFFQAFSVFGLAVCARFFVCIRFVRLACI